MRAMIFDKNNNLIAVTYGYEFVRRFENSTVETDSDGNVIEREINEANELRKSEFRAKYNMDLINIVSSCATVIRPLSAMVLNEYINYKGAKQLESTTFYHPKMT